MIPRMQKLRTLALQYPETEEGIACQGTALESCTVKVRNKAFLFLGQTQIRIKLHDSRAEEAKCSACKVGASGWVAIRLDDEETPAADVLERWLDESYRTMVPKPAKRAKAAQKG